MKPWMRFLLVVTMVVGAPTAVGGEGPMPHRGSPTPGAPGSPVPATLDEAGKLTEALPLYAARAEQTLTQTDRLRYAGALLRAGQPEQAKAIFEQSERNVPKGLLDGRKVDRAWRNAQRELRWVKLRQALALWQQGKRGPAVAEARKAVPADEAYVRAAATVLLAAADLAEKRHADAVATLKVLAGRDRRFAAPVAALESTLAAGRHPRTALADLEGTLADVDRSVDFLRRPLCEALNEIAQTDTAKPPALAISARR